MGSDMEPGSDPSDSDDPFKGTPMEGFFAAMGGAGVGNAGFGAAGMPDLSALFGQMQQFLQPSDGPVNFVVAKDVARQASAAAAPDPTPHAGQSGAVDDAVQLAEGWLDRATSIPAGATSSVAWSRADWIENTSDTWRTLIEPIATHVVTAMGDALPDEAKSMAGPLIGMLTQVGGAMFGQQIGQALAGLAGEVVSGTDIGLPLGPDKVAAILPTNVTAFGEGLEHRPSDVLLYVTLRECAHHRLFQQAPWLRGALVSAIEEFGRGTRLDMSGIESKLAGLDPAEIATALEGGLFEPERTPEQQAAVDRLETLLAFIEGWVDEVVSQATRDTMPAAAALAEAIRRRRAAGGPAEQTFASLVGLELRPRRLRDAATLFAALRDRFGADARDAVWTHPDLMPTAADLDDPLGFTPSGSDPDSDAAFDAALSELLDEDSDGPDSSSEA
jgi:putative hydrolase